MGGRVPTAGMVWLVFTAALGSSTVTCRADGQRKGQSDESQPPPRETLRMTEGIVCRSIEGYEDYEPMPEAAMTSDEKLLVYYRPFGYQTAFVKGTYQAHLTQDFQIRKRGQKTVLFQKLK